jgi:hypothetical protein
VIGKFTRRRETMRATMAAIGRARERSLIPEGATIRCALPEDALETAWLPTWDANVPLVLVVRHPTTGKIALLHVLTTDLEAALAE